MFLRFSFFFFSLLFLLGCSEKTAQTQAPVQTQAPATSFDDVYFYKQDSAMFANRNHKFVTSEEDVKIFFVKTWNTPDFYLIGDKKEWTGISWDGGMFLGCQRGAYVYTNEIYRGRSSMYKDSVILIERAFPKRGVTSDIRQSCWWIKYVQEVVDMPEEHVNIDTFLNNALGVLIEKGNKNDFKLFLKETKKSILDSKGETIKEKIINFTRASLGGDPQKWDAWKRPGYFN